MNECEEIFHSESFRANLLSLKESWREEKLSVLGMIHSGSVTMR